MNFDTYILHHRNLLVKGIKSCPQYFKEADLKVFDIVAAQTRKQFVNEQILNDFKPVIILKDPMDFMRITETVVVESIFLGKSSLLMEGEYSPEEVTLETNRALQSQISALNNLKAFYTKAEQSGLADQLGDFKAELDDIEKELDGIYGKLETTGTMSKLGAGLKKAFGWMQRGLGKVGAGTVADSGHELVHEQLDEGGADITNPLFGGMDKFADLTTQQAANWGHGTGKALHHVGKAIRGGIGKFFPKAAASTGAKTATSAASKGATTAAGKVATTAASKGATTAAGKVATAAAAKGAAIGGMGTGAALGVGAGVAALLAAGAAGVKMIRRRQRLEKLVAIASNFEKTNPQIRVPLVKPIPAPEAEKVTPNDIPTTPGTTPVTNTTPGSAPNKSGAPEQAKFKSEFMKRMLSRVPNLAGNLNAQKELEKLYSDLSSRYGQEATAMVKSGADNKELRAPGTSLQEAFKYSCLDLILEKLTLNEVSGKLYNIGYEIFSQMLKEPEYAKYLGRFANKAIQNRAKATNQTTQQVTNQQQLKARLATPEAQAKIAANKAKVATAATKITPTGTSAATPVVKPNATTTVIPNNEPTVQSTTDKERFRGNVSTTNHDAEQEKKDREAFDAKKKAEKEVEDKSRPRGRQGVYETKIRNLIKKAVRESIKKR